MLQNNFDHYVFIDERLKYFVKTDLVAAHSTLKNCENTQFL